MKKISEKLRQTDILDSMNNLKRLSIKQEKNRNEMKNIITSPLVLVVDSDDDEVENTFVTTIKTEPLFQVSESEDEDCEDNIEKNTVTSTKIKVCVNKPKQVTTPVKDPNDNKKALSTPDSTTSPSKSNSTIAVHQNKPTSKNNTPSKTHKSSLNNSKTLSKTPKAKTTKKDSNKSTKHLSRDASKKECCVQSENIATTSRTYVDNKERGNTSQDNRAKNGKLNNDNIIPNELNKTSNCSSEISEMGRNRHLKLINVQTIYSIQGTSKEPTELSNSAGPSNHQPNISPKTPKDSSEPSQSPSTPKKQKLSSNFPIHPQNSPGPSHYPSTPEEQINSPNYPKQPKDSPESGQSPSTSKQQNIFSNSPKKPKDFSEPFQSPSTPKKQKLLPNSLIQPKDSPGPIQSPKQSKDSPVSEQASSTPKQQNGIPNSPKEPKDSSEPCQSPSTPKKQKLLPNSSTQPKDSPGPSQSPSTPKKSNASQTSESPKKRGSPKKEEKGMNHNFMKIMNELISTVSISRYLRYVLGEENDILNAIQTSSTKYQYVCFKLYTWLPKWYNLFKFCNKIKVEMTDKEVVELYGFLTDNRIVDTDYTEESMDLLLNTLEVADVKSICEKFRLKKQSKKEMIRLIIENCNSQATLTSSKSIKDLVVYEIIKKFGKHVVKISEDFRKAFYHVYLLGTFTNPMFYDKSNFFRSMEDIATNFPEYEIQDYVVFYSRPEFLRYAEAREYRDKYEELLTSKNYTDMLQLGTDILQNLTNINQDDDDPNRFREIPHLERFTAKSVYVTTLTKIAATLKAKYFEEVLGWLEFLIAHFPESHRQGDWYFDLCGIYQRYKKDSETAAKLIMKALKDKREYLLERQIQNLGEKGEQLKSKVDMFLHDTIVELLPDLIYLKDFPQLTIDAKTVRENVTGKRHYEVQNDDGSKSYKFVEQFAMDHYIKHCGYTNGEHCEGAIIMATFTLFFWDIIYNKDVLVPGTFLSKIQHYPLDMFTKYFYIHRKDIIDKRLKDIAEDWSDEETLDFATKHWHFYCHKSSICVVENTIVNTDMLKEIVECIGRKTLSNIYERLVKDVRQYRSGMPDLLVWNKTEKKAKFVEVKGENDKLSVKQKLWLKYLQSINAHIEVCHVHSIGSKRKLTSPIKKRKEATPNIPCGSNDKPQNDNSDSDRGSDTELKDPKDENRKKLIKKKLFKTKNNNPNHSGNNESDFSDPEMNTKNLFKKKIVKSDKRESTYRNKTQSEENRVVTAELKVYTNQNDGSNSSSNKERHRMKLITSIEVRKNRSNSESDFENSRDSPSTSGEPDNKPSTKIRDTKQSHIETGLSTSKRKSSKKHRPHQNE